jgi:hypothetical protein
MIHKQLERLIPYISEEAITYPLWEEGNYTPFLNLDIVTEKLLELERSLQEKVNLKGYEFQIEREGRIFKISIYPDFEYNDEGSFDYMVEGWSIEEMIDIVAKVLNND